MRASLLTKIREFELTRRGSLVQIQFFLVERRASSVRIESATIRWRSDETVTSDIVTVQRVHFSAVDRPGTSAGGRVHWTWSVKNSDLLRIGVMVMVVYVLLDSLIRRHQHLLLVDVIVGRFVHGSGTGSAVQRSNRGSCGKVRSGWRRKTSEGRGWEGNGFRWTVTYGRGPLERNCGDRTSDRLQVDWLGVDQVLRLNERALLFDFFVTLQRENLFYRD